MKLQYATIFHSIGTAVHLITSNLHDTRGVTRKCVTSSGAHLRGLASDQYGSELCENVAAVANR